MNTRTVLSMRSKPVVARGSICCSLLPYVTSYASLDMATWSREETLRLIEIWGDDRIQAQLEGVHRNQDVFTKIAREMSESGFERTFQQCRDKLKKLKSEYRKLKDKQGKTGESKRKDWDYFEVMDAILGTKPATQPPVVVDTLQDSSDIQEDATDPEHEIIDDIPEDSGTVVSAREESSVPKSRTTTPSPSPTAVIGSRKRKDKAENTVAEMLQKVVECQSATEQKLMELEEKQMEREIQLRREEREFQLRMMQMLVGRPSFYTDQPPMPYQASPPIPFLFGSSPPPHHLTFMKDKTLMKSSRSIHAHVAICIKNTLKVYTNFQAMPACYSNIRTYTIIIINVW